LQLIGLVRALGICKRLLGFICFLCGLCLNSGARAEQPVALSQNPMTYSVVSDTDLTSAFHTKSKWRLVITQEPDSDESPTLSSPGNLHLCFIHKDSPECLDLNYTYNILDGVKIIPSNDTLPWPLLVLTADDFTGGSGQPKGTLVWVYHSKLDRFERIFENVTSQNHNEETRIIKTGPLSGDIIIDLPTFCHPWPYRIIAYRLSRGHYVEAFNYLGRTRYEDGDPRPVIDSEMPQIERRLLNRPADIPLQVTRQTHPRCKNYSYKSELNLVR
jgi:hypothetical protein